MVVKEEEEGRRMSELCCWFFKFLFSEIVPPGETQCSSAEGGIPDMIRTGFIRKETTCVCTAPADGPVTVERLS